MMINYSELGQRVPGYPPNSPHVFKALRIRQLDDMNGGLPIRTAIDIDREDAFPGKGIFMVAAKCGEPVALSDRVSLTT